MSFKVGTQVIRYNNYCIYKGIIIEIYCPHYYKLRINKIYWQTKTKYFTRIELNSTRDTFLRTPNKNKYWDFEIYKSEENVMKLILERF